MTRFTNEQRNLISCDPDSEDYSYKYTLRSTKQSWTMIYYMNTIAMDVLVRVYHLDHGRSAKIYEHTKHLLNVRSEYLLTPEKVFHWAGELWLVFPYCAGRPLNDVLTRHFTGGVPNERLIARILLDILEGLDVLHKGNLCHRGLATFTLQLCKDTGQTMLKDFTNIKLTDTDDNSDARATRMKPDQNYHLKPPEMLGFAEEKPEDVNEKMADVYLFATTALSLAYGTPPPAPPSKTKAPMEIDAKTWSAASHKLYPNYPKRPDHVSDLFIEMITPCFNRATKNRPTVSKLMKHKFFKNAASHKDVQEKICSLLKIQQPTGNLSKPPSQTKESLNPLRAPSSGWDFSDVVKASTTSDQMATIKEGLDERIPEMKEDVPAQVNVGSGLVLPSEHCHLEPVSHPAPIDPRHLEPPLSIDDPPLPVPQQSHTGSRFKVLDEHVTTLSPSVTKPSPSPITNPNDDRALPLQQPAQTQKKSRFHVSNDEFQEGIPPPHAQGEPPSMSGHPEHDPQGRPRQISQPKSRFKVEEQDLELPEPAQPTKDPSEWSVEEVCNWLQSLGGDYGKYILQFRDAGIDGQMLPDLTDEEMQELGVSRGINRRKLKTSIKKVFQMG